MDEDVKVALEASIEHWKQNAENPQEAKIGITACALCMMFNRKDMAYGYCEGCPVYEKTARKWCGGTPYADFIRINRAEFRSARAWTNALRKAAKAEVVFLESLREG